MDQHSKKVEQHNRWKDFGHTFCDYVDENMMDWPITSLQWGGLLQSNSQYATQRLFFSCRTDGVCGPDHVWQGHSNMIIMSSVELPQPDHYFINELKSMFNPEAAKKHPNMKIKTVITHPGEVTIIRSCPSNRKILASKNDVNQVFIWSSDRYKTMPGSYSNFPDVTLKSTKSDKANYALRFCPSLQRIISASGNVLELFDLEQTGPTKRELGSVISSSTIAPSLTLTGHEGVQDIVFQSNQIWLSGGQDKQIGVWDYRMKSMVHKIDGIHNHDINCLSVSGNTILSGGEEGRVNFIDNRKFQAIAVLETEKPVRSIAFNPQGNYFAVGNDKISFYKSQDVVNSFQPVFSYFGLRGSINQFDWNHEFPFCIAATCQDLDVETPSSGGGLVHIFKPSSLFFEGNEDRVRLIEEAFGKLSQREKEAIELWVDKK